MFGGGWSRDDVFAYSDVFKLATHKFVYVTKISAEIVVVIANTSELNRRIELTPNRFVVLFFQIYTKL